jgi:hypothetical protein
MTYVHKCQTKEVLTVGTVLNEAGTIVKCIFIMMLCHELQFSALLASVIMFIVAVDTSVFVEQQCVMDWSKKFLI